MRHWSRVTGRVILRFRGQRSRLLGTKM